MSRIGRKRSVELIHDVLSASHDIESLAKKHKLLPRDLASWASQDDTQQTLVGLCVLSDLQTQLLMSRYRTLAADRLARLATDQEGEATADVSRKACVDLLRLDLKRVGQVVRPRDSDEDGDESGSASIEALRELLFASKQDLFNTNDENSTWSDVHDDDLGDL